MFMNEINREDLRIVDILRLAQQVFQNNFNIILIILLVVMVPVDIIISIINTSIIHINNGIDFVQILQNGALLEKYITSSQFYQSNALNLIAMVIDLLIMPVGIMSIAKLVKNTLYGVPNNAKDLILEAFSKTAYFVIAFVIYSILSTIGLLLFIIPGVILIVWWRFYGEAVMLNDKKPIGALKYSRALVKGKWVRVFSVTIAFAVLNAVSDVGIEFLFSWGTNLFFSDAIVRVLTSFITLYFACCTTILYLNLESMKKKDETKGTQITGLEGF